LEYSAELSSLVIGEIETMKHVMPAILLASSLVVCYAQDNQESPVKRAGENFKNGVKSAAHAVGRTAKKAGKSVENAGRSAKRSISGERSTHQSYRQHRKIRHSKSKAGL
jgi:hypothetical protein